MVENAADATIKPYAACSVQAYWENYNPNLNGEFEGDTLKQRNLQRMCAYIDACFKVGAIPRPVKLVCFPEFSIGGLYTPTTTTEEVKKWQAITIPGPETDVLAEKAREHNIYIAASNHENDPLRPDYFFNTAFIINPQGKIILKYRKLNVRFGCNPHDILDEYQHPVTGTFDPFPVVDTSIGRLACMICGDINIPEIPRVYAIKGADVIIRCDSGYGSWDMAIWTLRVRARDNKIYIVNDNWSARVLTTEEVVGGNRIPVLVDTQGGGGAAVIDYEGNIVRAGNRVAEARGTAPQLVIGSIDVMALRNHRLTSMDGPAGIRTELYAPYYNKPIYPVNSVLKEGPLAHRAEPKKNRWDQEGRDNWKKLWDFYSENDVK
ncbi:nitrilase-related carbon-nitrogen hydrolase [Bacteroidota bacterium]